MVEEIRTLGPLNWPGSQNGNHHRLAEPAAVPELEEARHGR
jgi:hypothetical protein